MNFRLTTIVIAGIVAVGGAVAIIPQPRGLREPIVRRVVSIGLHALPTSLREKDWRGQGRGGNEKTMPLDPPDQSASNRSGNDSQAEQLLAQAIAMLERCPAFAAKTRQSVYLYGKHLVGSGDYLEYRQDGIHRFRIELKMQIGEELRSLQLVCDGRYLWRSESYQGRGSAERVDLARIARAVEGQTQPLSPDQLLWRTRLGGLSKLLRNLRDHFCFTAVVPTALADQTPVFRLEGSWRPDRLASLIHSEGVRVQIGKRTGDLPEHIPDRVALFLGRDDLFPFRIEYRRRCASLLPGEEEERITVAMDLFEVSFHPAVNPSRFTFTPGNLEHSDQTDRFLERLGVVNSR